MEKSKKVKVFAICNQFHIVMSLFKYRNDAIKNIKKYINTDYFYYHIQKISVITTDKKLM